MEPIPVAGALPTAGGSQVTSSKAPASTHADDAKLREAFDRFVGETFYSQLLGSMRKTVGKPAYFHGGQAEEIFQQQLDRVLAEKIAKAEASNLTGAMYELFTLGRP